jgi:hypothetical protein
LKQGITFESSSDVYDYYYDRGGIITIVNIEQIMFYTTDCNLQPDWIMRSPYNRRLIALYGKERTADAWERWRNKENLMNKERELSNGTKRRKEI